jgi:hypothetical protein
MYYLILLFLLLITIQTIKNSYTYKWFLLAIKGPYFPGNRLDDSDSD